MKNYLTLFSLLICLYSSGVTASEFQNSKEIIEGSSQGHQVLKITFDSDNRPTIKNLDTSSITAKLWKSDPNSLPKYLTEGGKLCHLFGEEFDPRTNNHGYDIFGLKGFVDLSTPGKPLVYRTMALKFDGPTIISGRTKIVIYPACSSPFESIFINATDPNEVMHFKGGLPLFGSCAHQLFHALSRPLPGLLCHTQERVSGIIFPCIETVDLKATNATIRFVMKSNSNNEN